jgi:hypothetical protein
MIVTVAAADIVESTTDLAVTVTVGGLGMLAGALYRPAASIVPQLAPEQPVPATLQATTWLAPPGLTIALNRAMSPI